MERVNGAVERAHQAYQLLSAPYQWPLYKHRRQDERQPSLLKQCLDQVAPVLTVIINTSLSCADFTPELKRAFVTPLIKKLIFDCEIFKNYRPVSNLSFISKLIERIICVQLVDHLKENDLYEIFQSACRQLHSTETALLRVQNDILQAVDSEGGAILILLDLSAAFDTIDHQKLLD